MNPQIQAFMKNWKTTVAGVIVIALGALHTYVGINIPGFTLDFVSALPVGLGLIFAQDAVPPIATKFYTIKKDDYPL